MKITELLTKDTIIMELKARTKLDAINELVEKLNSANKLNDKEQYRKAILEREEQFSTGVGDGIAIPHAKSNSVKASALACGFSREGIDFDALDEKPVHIFFMIAGSAGAHNDHLETLSRLSVMLMKEEFRDRLQKAVNEQEILNLIDEMEELDEKRELNTEGTEDKLVLAVTACPTGIAHTYMAADALKKKAADMGVKLKVETNGSTGIKNKLTEEEISKAEAVIVAADKQVDMARFEGKKVLQVSVVQGIKAPQELISKALKGEAPVYRHHEKVEKTEKQSSSPVREFYKHLMNGVSNMLPFAVGGGVLIAIASLLVNSGYTAFTRTLMYLGLENAFSLMIPVMAAFIGMSIADRPGFAPAMIGGFISAATGAGFVGGIIAGFLGGYIVLLLKKIFKRTPASLESMLPVIVYPVIGIVLTGGIMLFLTAGPLRNFNSTIMQLVYLITPVNRIILGILFGGMMAIDMGGPINKTAFTLGIAMIDAGYYLPHAAVMAGGMVPPLGIAIATTLFKNKFTGKELEAGKKCYAMGALFNTEGAIPFAMADPKVVLPAMTLGSAAAGALSMAFNIGLPTPHGGIFVIPIVFGNPILYAAAILCGALLTAVILGVFKKPVE